MNTLPNPKCFAILAASGSSVRFGSDKLNLQVDGIPVWRKSYQILISCPLVSGVGVVTRQEKISEILAAEPGMTFVVSGGETRAQSIRNAMAHVPRGSTHVLIHDAARPFASADLIERVIASAFEHGAAFPGLSLTETVRQANNDSWHELDRSQIMRVQTPQVVRRDWFEQALSQIEDDLTDDVGYLIAAGFPVQLVQGEPENMKITHPSDLPQMPEYRMGFGYDVHRFSEDPNRPLWLGGVEFDERPGLEGHSDADALLHAVVDALLGAAGEGDIGVHYPPSDEQWKDCPSVRFLSEAANLLKSKGWHIVNIDATVVAERPKVMPKSLEIRKVISESIEVAIERVSVKATTNEKLGSIGKSEGIACYAVATIRR
ncbi:MAG: 2-C-methyl-D-erythritol 2,4-cyclodiphosphate synthase [Fimbriimonadaceae bacterium]|nr:MAG: 2-C-methyl-D-erythritol 2,4-cyclodiphosphate synthase [Fimbriimonadaceae bacterium]